MSMLYIYIYMFQPWGRGGTPMRGPPAPPVVLWCGVNGWVGPSPPCGAVVWKFDGWGVYPHCYQIGFLVCWLMIYGFCFISGVLCLPAACLLSACCLPAACLLLPAACLLPAWSTMPEAPCLPVTCLRACLSGCWKMQPARLKHPAHMPWPRTAT